MEEEGMNGKHVIGVPGVDVCPSESEERDGDAPALTNHSNCFDRHSAAISE